MWAVLILLAVAAFDAWRFPVFRHDTEGMRAYHKRLVAVQLACVFLCYALAGWVQALVLVVWLVWGFQDLCYHLWRLAWRAETWAQFEPFGGYLYAKPTNLGWLLHSSVVDREWPWEVIGDPEPRPKWIDTAYRLVGLALGIGLWVVVSWG